MRLYYLALLPINIDGMLTDGKNQVLVLAFSQQFERRWLGYLTKGYQSLYCKCRTKRRANLND